MNQTTFTLCLKSSLIAPVGSRHHYTLGFLKFKGLLGLNCGIQAKISKHRKNKLHESCSSEPLKRIIHASYKWKIIKYKNQNQTLVDSTSYFYLIMTDTNLIRESFGNLTPKVARSLRFMRRTNDQNKPLFFCSLRTHIEEIEEASIFDLFTPSVKIKLSPPKCKT